jgi:peptide/nickel transport system substrate-binding protein
MVCVKRWPVLLVALALVVSATTCKREERVPAAAGSTPFVDDTTPQEGGTLVRRFESDIATVNPVLATSRYDRMVDNLVFTPLLYLSGDLKLIPGLADKWEVSKDGKEYTFHLNPKATFSDGTHVLASDVVFTLHKIVDPQMEAAQIAAGFEQLDPAKTRAVDESTVIIAFKQALAGQMVRFNDLLVVPEHVYGKGNFKEDFTSRPVGSGPYRLVRREPGKEILLERRQDYWGEKPYIQNVLVKVIVDQVTAWNALKHNDIDETQITSDMWVMESDRPELKKTINFRRFYTLNYNYIAWNEKVPAFADKRVRRAMGMCLNLPAIINNLYHGTARAVSGPFTPDEWAYNPSVPVLPFDPLAAKQILTSSGWLDTDGDGIVDKDHKPLKFDLFIFSGSPTATALGQLLQDELKKIGVAMNVVPLDPSTLIQRVLAGNFQAVYMGWDLDADPDPFGAFHSSQIPPRGQNFTGYHNPEVDKLIEQGRTELDASKRQQIFYRLHEMLADDQPYTWTIQVANKWAISKRVRNVKDSRGWGLYTWYPGEFDWWIPKDQRIHDQPGH